MMNDALLDGVIGAVFSAVGDFGSDTPDALRSRASNAIRAFLESQPYRELAPTMVAHGNGNDTNFHPFGQLCANCRPPVEITDEMVERAMRKHEEAGMRAALEAAFNGA